MVDLVEVQLTTIEDFFEKVEEFDPLAETYLKDASLVVAKIYAQYLLGEARSWPAEADEQILDLYTFALFAQFDIPLAYPCKEA